MKTKLLIGAIALSTLIFTGCGSSSSSSGGTNPPPVQPAPDPTEPPLSNNGNQILLPGYTYNCSNNNTFELYATEDGNVVLDNDSESDVKMKMFDSNYNPYEVRGAYGLMSNEWRGNTSVNFKAGQYYITPESCKGNGGFSVQSNVLYNPLAQ